MPMLILTVPHYFDKLLEYRRLTAITSLCEFEREMVVTVNTAIVLVVRILWTKHGRTYRTGKMLDMKLLVQSCNVGTT